MENNQFDEIDEKILQMLAKDGNIPFQEVARAVEFPVQPFIHE